MDCHRERSANGAKSNDHYHGAPARRALLALLASVLFATSAVPAAEVAPYDIQTVLSLTGPAAFVGKAVVESLGMLEKIVNAQGGINGRPVHFVYYDGQSSPQVAVQLVTQIIAKNVPVILGPSFSNTCRAVMPLVANGPVLYCLSEGVDPADNSYVFSSGVSIGDLLVKNLDFLRKRGWTRIATLTTTDSTGQNADDNIDRAKSRLAGSGVTIVDREHFNNADISIAAQLSRLKAANPQALIAWTTGPPIGTVFQGLKTAGWDIPLLTTAGNESYPLMKQFAAIVPKELYLGAHIYVTGGTRPANRTVLRQFYDSYAAIGERPDQLSGDAWDPALVLIDALRHTGPTPTAAQIHDYIEKLHGLPGIIGVYDFRDGHNRGLGIGVLVDARWDVGKSTWVEIP